MPFRHIFSQWFRAKTQETVRRTVQQAAADHLARERENLESAAGGDPICEVGFVFALEIEAGGLVDLLKRSVTVRGKALTVRRGMLDGRRVVVATTGAGQARARRATEALIEAHHPRWIVSAGFAGGLRPELHRHDLVMADALVGSDGRRMALDLRVDRATLPEGVHVGALVTVEQVVRRPEEKRRLGEQTGALAVDTETLAVAAVCQERHVSMLAVRVLTDAVDETLPADVQHLTDQTTLASQLGAALGTVWRRPKSVKDLWGLKETALVGSDRLAKFLVDLIKTLGPPPPALENSEK